MGRMKAMNCLYVRKPSRRRQFCTKPWDESRCGSGRWRYGDFRHSFAIDCLVLDLSKFLDVAVAFLGIAIATFAWWLMRWTRGGKRRERKILGWNTNTNTNFDRMDGWWMACLMYSFSGGVWQKKWGTWAPWGLGRSGHVIGWGSWTLMVYWKVWWINGILVEQHEWYQVGK